jgi:hypothetical protein
MEFLIYGGYGTAGHTGSAHETGSNLLTARLPGQFILKILIDRF